MICLTAETEPMSPKMEKTRAIMEFNQKVNVRLEGLKVTLNNTTGRTKSSGRNPNAPITAFISPKNGSIADNVVAMPTDRDRDITLGITFRAENCSLFGSANNPSSTSFVGCKYICHRN